ncbi:40S ribosomal protein S7 [Schizosaccharomyces japonicus yFS275]|uniref:40S ribosomal protein S7 n=1 Tax=Schizosaccharomyces japonicus (strain yFS275 / FY16936) TaxID=402676 RepID=B6JZK6_SCHJY|nr:40S ribosomal protein S7 [Schizosaccharomyces japonicus yFS275]EEB06974.1 40S ribosomal protein S7 [Schizosaccharomyces japonicus yFS275]
MSALNKIVKRSSSKPSETDLLVAQCLYDLETSSKDLAKELRPLQFTSAREVEVGSGKKAIVVFVPQPLLKAFHKVQARLTRELEKKFAERHVIFIAQRRILPKPSRHSRVTQKRPRSRTLTAVHDSILEDIVFPTVIVGKRTRQTTDGKKTIKVFLDNKDANTVDYKLGSFTAIYHKLTGKNVSFEFPVTAGEGL